MANLKKIKNVLWLFLGKFGVVFLSIFTFVFFALYLSPTELGKGALVIAIVEMLSVFFSSMIETPLARRKFLTIVDKSSSFWFGGAIAIVFSFVLVILIYLAYEDSVMSILVGIGCLKFLFSVLSRSFMAELRIQREFKALAIRTLAGKIVGASVAIVLAIKGAGEISVIMQPVVMELISFLILISAAGIPPIKSSLFSNFKSVVREGYSYAIKFSCNSLLEKFTVIALSITTSLELVGLYTFAKRLVELPRTALQSAINTYAIPVFAKKASDIKAFNSFFLEISIFTILVFSPAFVWYGIVFSDVLVVVFSEKWIGASPYFIALSFIAALRFVDIYIPSLLASQGKSGVGLISEAVSVIIYIFLVWVSSYQIGIWGAIVCIAFYTITLIWIRLKALEKVFKVTSFLRKSCIALFFTFLSGSITEFGGAMYFQEVESRIAFSILMYVVLVLCFTLFEKGLYSRIKSLLS